MSGTQEKAAQPNGLPELIAFDAKRSARIVTPGRAHLAAQRLIDSHFNNADREHARMSIPVNLDDDDIVIHDFIDQSSTLLAVNKELLEALERAILAIRRNIGHHKPAMTADLSSAATTTMASGYYQSLPCIPECPMCEIWKWLPSAEAAIARARKD